VTSDLFSLPWLLPAPPDFKARARAALAVDSLDQVEVRKLGAYALDLSGLETMGKVVRKHRTALIRKAGLTPFRLGIASSHTMNYVASALPGTALRHNLVLEVLLAGLGEDPRELLNSESEFGRASLDAILIALDYRVLNLAEAQLTPEEAEVAVRGAISYVAECAAGVRAIGTTCILQTLVPPASSLFGSLDGRVPGSVRAMVERFNEQLMHEVATEDDLMLDAAFLASAVGLSAWNHARDWNKSKLPGALDSTPLYADHICRLLGAARGRARKCLVMDLDNTLWGGAIEEDGLAGIRLGRGTSVGEAHTALQRYVLDLRRRGVILAVCSQNTEATARLPFRAHPEMVLREDHIAAFFANCSDKASNIREIAASLNIGTDAVVFIDDNPAERALVRELLPEVAVPELTADPADYAGLLSTAGYFEAARLSREDIDRAGFYRRSTWNRLRWLRPYRISMPPAARASPI
jgi:HAD superfamily phosphatase (TIGR01681 family)